MAEETTMSPVEPANKPAIKKPVIGGAGALKPGLKLPPKPGLPTAGLKLPPKPAGAASPLKTVTTATPFKPGLKMPTTPALKTGLRLPTKPVIRKPGTAVAAPAPAAVAAAPAAPTDSAPVAPAAPAQTAPVAAPAAAAVAPVVAPPVAPAAAGQDGSLATLKAVTQSLKGTTAQIPQQAILRKTGIIADSSKEMSEAQKQASKSKTSRISLSDAVGIAQVKNENAPMKTIRIKRPANLPANGPAPVASAPVAATVVAPPPVAKPVAEPAADKPAADQPAATSSVSVTQRKTIKITRPSGGVVRPSGKFGISKPAAAPAPAASAPVPAPASSDSVADIPDIAEMPTVAALPTVEAPKAVVADVPVFVTIVSMAVQIAACVAMGALAWFLYQDAALPVM